MRDLLRTYWAWIVVPFVLGVVVVIGLIVALSQGVFSGFQYSVF